MINTIKAAAAKANCCADTLRNYERAGLIQPARDSAGRRLYTDADIALARAHRAKTRAKFKR